MSEEEEQAAAAAADARAAAEARRRRILEQSQQRMGIVSGGGAGGSVDEADAADDTKASRLQAMRRRRFQQKAAKKEQQSEKTGDGTEDVLQAKEEEEEEDTGAAETEAVAAPATTTTEEETTAAADAATSEATTGKKYMGVARMRRKKLKEQQEAAAAAAKEPTKTTAVTTTFVSPQNIPLLPIVLQLLAVLLLFLAGLDVGLQRPNPQDEIIVVETTTVHRQLAPQQHGVGLWNKLVRGSKATDEDDDSTLLQVVLDDEFVSHKKHMDEFEDDDTAATPNIDLLFRVDLDELTQGPGIFMTLARGAVKIHRMLLFLFWEVPISILSQIVTLPQKLWSTPPIFCLVALVIRQTIHKLGGDIVPGEADKQSKDVLAMLKMTVMKFLAGMFPTAVTLYNVWTHLRSDMYVMLCGFFVGVAWVSTSVSTIAGDKAELKEEL